ncbi:MAG: amino acid--tRNA ligase-related protein [Patescibacteria group bacterium]
MINNYIATKDVVAFSEAVNRLRAFFLDRGFKEVHTQDRLSILAACEDPTTIATYDYAGERWPLPQTGQMWLEYELLRQPELPGVFCVSTSYRNEKNPVPGRHEIIFPMFEFESKGELDDLRDLEIELCEQLGFGDRDTFVHRSYDEAADHYATNDLTSQHELQMHDEFGPVFFLEHFPVRTSPFWNMRKQDDHAHKIDVILCGMETIGSAERSTDPEAMRRQFYTISDGKYSDLLFNHFGRQRVENELEDFLSFNFFPRFGGGIGMTRMIRALQNVGSL